MVHLLPQIPLVEAPEGPLELARLLPQQCQTIVGKISQLLPSPLLRWGDRYSERWLRASNNPYLKEIAEVAVLLARPGGYALNFSFEMACTTGCKGFEGHPGMQLFRTLDWPFRLGADIVVAKHETPVGPYYNLTWPGYIGVLTAIAKGRFAAAINQPPMNYSFESLSLGLPIDWVANRIRIRKRREIPPVHLLRQAFEKCKTYADAKLYLSSTPICIPVIYTLTGPGENEGCIIEKREHDCVIHEGPVCISNHWLNDHFKGRPRQRLSSKRRLAYMQKELPTIKGDFDWLQAPVLDTFTRLATELNPYTGSMKVRGWHGDVPQTEVFSFTA